MPKLYIIAGCNGAGKTTSSYTVLPEILDCEEFVNADEIAKGLSPFNSDAASIQAGRLMLERINVLRDKQMNFSFETTLSTKSFVNFVLGAQKVDYQVTLLFFYLNSEDLAVSRVKTRVAEGGHDIPENVIRRRYNNGLSNLFRLYMPIVDDWVLIDNSGHKYEVVAEGKKMDYDINNEKIWLYLKLRYDKKRR